MRGYLTRWGLSFYFYRQAAPNEESRTGVLPEKEERQPSLLAYERVDMELVGATIRPSQVQTTNRSPWGQNYYLAHCSQGILDVRGYGEIVVHAVWPGIDWVLRYEAGGIKQEFIVQAGADLSQVRLRWWGHSIPEVAPSRLSLHTQYGTLTEERLLAYHGIEPRTMAYQILARRQHADGLQVMEIGFTVEGLHQKPQATLLLDPVLQWGTYFGGNEADSPTDITTDPNGNLIVTGNTVVSPDFPYRIPAQVLIMMTHTTEGCVISS